MKALPTAFLEALRAALPDDALQTGRAATLAYGVDNSAFHGEAQAVAWPTGHEQVEAILAACHAHGVPVVARGRGSNTTGASVPVHGGLVLSFERMNRILAIDPGNRAAVVEPGLLNGDLQRALAPHGLFWAPDPTSAPWSSIGGNLACNAGGPRAVKYGACRDNLLALRAVDGRGRGFRSGAAVTKNATGFDLARLLVGSEGTLALITEATLLLRPLPQARRGLRAVYRDTVAAAEAVARLMAQPVTPAAVEFMDEAALALVRQRGVDLPDEAGALLLLEVDGRAATLDEDVGAITEAARGEGLIALDSAADASALADLWAARKALSPALKSLAPDKINEDVVVPVSRLPDLVAACRQLAAAHPIAIVCFGHAGNGNLHVNLMFDRADPVQAAAAAQCLDAVFERVLALGGALSGEHGIGLGKRDFMARALQPATLDLMRAIKRQFDPAGLLNPGKLLPDATP
ncbi:MAG: FAD-linked oxidase C-terminal domain-containing protein [Lysobacteraceae bacterium]